MKAFLSSLVLLLGIQLTTSATNPDHYLVSYELVTSHDMASIKKLWKEKAIPKFIMPVKNAVDIYEIIYKVKWVDSTWRTASGIYYVPKVDKPVPYFMFGHG